jgi:hypothetical protein
MSKQYYCIDCEKFYKSAKSLYLHKTTYHAKAPQKKKKLICTYCKKIFIRYDHYTNHIERCCKLSVSSDDNLPIGKRNTKTNVSPNIPLNLDDTYNSKEHIIKNLEHMIDGQLFDQVKNQLGMSHSNIGDQNNYTDNRANNNNSGISGYNNSVNHTINQIKIVPLGQENLSEILTAKEQINILNKRCQALEEIIKYVHFNDKYPQFQNMMISDLNRDIAYKYDTDKHDYVMVKKSDLINNLIENRVDDIDEFYNNNFEKLGKANQKIIGQYIDNLTNDEENNEGRYLQEKKKDIELVMYNNQSMIKKKILKLRKNKINQMIID